MNEEILDKTLNVRLSMPVFMRLREIARMEDLKIADLIRRAIRKTYGLPKSK
jgi:predicted DNA-binding ribbon-helix-helix protein